MLNWPSSLKIKIGPPTLLQEYEMLRILKDERDCLRLAMDYDKSKSLKRKLTKIDLEIHKKNIHVLSMLNLN